MKNKLIVFGVVLLIGAWIFFDARSNYSWSEIIMEKKSAEGWTLAATQDNFADLIRPWTWFKTPVTGLWFIKLNESRQLGPLVIAPVLRVSYDYSKTEQEEHVEFFDIPKGKSAFLPEKTPI